MELNCKKWNISHYEVSKKMIHFKWFQSHSEWKAEQQQNKTSTTPDDAKRRKVGSPAIDLKSSKTSPKAGDGNFFRFLKLFKYLAKNAELE